MLMLQLQARSSMDGAQASTQTLKDTLATLSMQSIILFHTKDIDHDLQSFAQHLCKACAPAIWTSRLRPCNLDKQTRIA